MEVFESASFRKAVKKLHQKQKDELFAAIRAILQNPQLGEQKRGDLVSIRVHKFRMLNQVTLLAYQLDGDERLILQDLGSHENFYRDLKTK